MSGDIALWFIILFRLFIPFTILKWPLAGAFLGILGDISDVLIGGFFNITVPFGLSYHYADKVFDIWYLFFEFIVVMTWKDKIARNVGAVLFTWRFTGFLSFMLTDYRPSFLFAPNIFEFFFLATLILSFYFKKRFNKEFKYTYKSATIVLLAVGIPNIIKEYIMHYKFQNQTWAFFKDSLFWWLYD